MNNEDFARLYHKLFKEELAAHTGADTSKSPTWDNIGSELQEVMLRTADRMLEQVQAPLRAKIKEVVGDAENPKMVISAKPTWDQDMDTILLIESALDLLDDDHSKMSVLDFVQNRIERSSNKIGEVTGETLR